VEDIESLVEDKVEGQGGRWKDGGFGVCVLINKEVMLFETAAVSEEGYTLASHG
jgi:hypothetical protein